MVITLLFFTCYCSFILAIVSYGGFDHLILSETIKRTILYVLLSEAFYVLTTTTLKISFGLFFLRVLMKPWQRATFYVILAICISYSTLYVFIAIFQCGLPTELLEYVVSGQGCLPTDVLLGFGYTYSAISIIADWVFVVIPIFMLAETSIDRRSKVSVGVIIALGAVGSISSVIRLVYLKGILFGKDFFCML
ncbi:hypothetical protein AOQ84DRAFT_401738 [Glonium stellatum]|uniref:Rhodopsin domain-containing protein n=1 Tax=Glonium stellatum TaxID=574774 RepID=A0A8E2EMT2_9PEZI|nr:hypothetical protein AOQ84DRAFT_401738 [Glonium stellatum]